MASKLYVGNLSFETGEADLQELFGTQGEVLTTNLVTDRDTGRSRGFAFVEMAKAEDAQSAIENLDGRDFKGRNLKVNIARPRENRSTGDRGRNRNW